MARGLMRIGEVVSGVRRKRIEAVRLMVWFFVVCCSLFVVTVAVANMSFEPRLKLSTFSYRTSFITHDSSGLIIIVHPNQNSSTFTSRPSFNCLNIFSHNSLLSPR
jgi:hypothetical protein